LRSGAEVVYQATFLRDGLRGHADFLFRVDRPSDLGEFSYEVADTKLARRAKPYFVLQLCFYSELLAAAQGVEPEQIHVILGNGERRTFRLAEFSAYFRRVRAAFLAALADGGRNTYPEPVAHCEICRWRSVCDEKREADDHLSLVANITARQRELLTGAGIETLAALGGNGHLAVRGVDSEVLARLHEQASLQLAARESGENSYELRTPQEGRGFARMPQPSEGDVFFDMEGDPLFDDGGLEYLFGFVAADGEEPEFTAIWGRDRAEEKRALEEFVDFVTERRKEFGDLHVYHYNHYEVTELKRIAGAHGTREEELDQLLRDADLPAQLLDQEGRGLLHGSARHRGDRRRRFRRHVRALAGGGRREDPRGDRRLQPRRLHLDAEAARLALGFASGGRAAVRRLG
jgi:uncharacterized protein